MIRELFSQPQILFQTPDEDFGVPEPAIGISIDTSGTIVLQQESDTILVNRASVRELCEVLRELDMGEGK